MTQSPKTVLQQFEHETHLMMAEKVGKTLSKQQKNKVLDILIADVNLQGITKVLKVLKVPQLKMVCDKHPGVDLKKAMEELSPKRTRSRSPRRARSKSPGGSDRTTSKSPKRSESKEGKKAEKKYPPKQVMVKILADLILESNCKKFFEHECFEASDLLTLCEDIDDLSEITKEDKKRFEKKELIKAIVQNVYTFGLEHLFSLFNVKELNDLCKELKLKCDSTSSKDTLIEAIMDHKAYKKPKKSKEPKPSEEKPEIKEGISKVDLNSWYKKQDLEDWLKSKGAKRSGKKTELFNRIIAYLIGDR
jgi:hypothetical protein